MKKIKGRKVLIFDHPPGYIEDKNDDWYDKPYYIQLDSTQGEWIERGFMRRCDASQFANKHGAKEIQHWEAC